MKILQVVHSYPPHGLGGVENFTSALSSALAGRHDVRVLSFDTSRFAGGVVEDRRAGLTIDWWPWPWAGGAPSRPGLLGRMGSVFAGRFGLGEPLERYYRALLRDWAPDLVHFQHLRGFPRSLPGLTRGAGVPYVIHLHDYWWICPTVKLFDVDEQRCAGPERRKCLRCVKGPAHPGLLELWHYARRPARHRAVLAEAALLIANSSWTRLRYRRFGTPLERMSVVPVALPRVSSSRVGHQVPPLRVAYLGSGQRAKGVHILLEAVRAMREPVRLSLHGLLDEAISAQAMALERDFPGRVRCCGPYPREQVGVILEAADVVVLPSLWNETYGLVVDEAAAAGVPVIGSRVGGLQEHIFEGRNGFLVPPGDEDALRASLERLAVDYEGHTRKLRCAETVPDFAAMVTRIEEHYENLLTVRAPPRVLDLRVVSEELSGFLERPRGVVERALCAAPEDVLLRRILAEAQDEEKLLLKWALDTFVAHGVATVVDASGGLGESAALFAGMGLEVVLVERSERLAAFVRFRLARRGLEVAVVAEPPVPCDGLFVRSVGAGGEPSLGAWAGLLAVGGVLIVVAESLAAVPEAGLECIASYDIGDLCGRAWRRAGAPGP